MRAILVRIGADHSYGHWNAPVDPVSCEFVYVPIPDSEKKRYRPRCRRGYREILPALRKFSEKCGIQGDFHFPRQLWPCAMHLDPDFETLTYGDNGRRRGKQIAKLQENDLLVFYAGLRSIKAETKLVYALVGVYFVQEVIRAVDVSARRYSENAHTRWRPISEDDIIVRAKTGISGRFKRCIPIGEWRNRSYRVRKSILKAWGGLSVNDGYIQRSARPPEFLKPKKFLRWLQTQKVELSERIN
jgi:hypothetical protein